MSGDAPAVGPGDRARATVFVAVTPADAFEVFTKEIDGEPGLRLMTSLREHVATTERAGR